MEEVFPLGMTLRHKFRSIWNKPFIHLYVIHYCQLPDWIPNPEHICSLQKREKKAYNLHFLMPLLTPLLSKPSQWAKNEARWKVAEKTKPQVTGVFGLDLERACEVQER